MTSINAVENDFVEIIREIYRKSPKTEIYLFEVTPRYDTDTDVQEINSVIRDLCLTYRANLIQTTQYIRSVNSQQYWLDRIHLSDRGTPDLLRTYDGYVPKLTERIPNDKT